jgi:hypothetical protein
MSYKDLSKLEDVLTVPAKTYITQHAPWLAAEITLEEALQVPLPKKEDF